MTRIGTRWQIRGTTRWMTRDEMLGMNPNVMLIPEKTRLPYYDRMETRTLPRYRCECVTTSTRKQCARRAHYRYINVDGKSRDMCGLHFGAWGVGATEDQSRFDRWYYDIGFVRNDEDEVDDLIGLRQPPA